MRGRRPRLGPAFGLALLGLTACGKKGDAVPSDAPPSATAPSPGASGATARPSAGPPVSASAFKPAAPVASGLPAPVEVVSKTVNPDNEPEYRGPTGTVRGLVVATGDAAPTNTKHLSQIKGPCPQARETYGKLFREGMMRSLGDVLVAVTGYAGYVPEKEPKQVISARGCAFSTRTVALTFGQTLDVASKDAEGYVPNLLGSKMKAQMVAMPGGAPATLYPPLPGHYILTDDIKLYMMADVFVLKYSTHAVTSVDGRFEIRGIPVGKSRVSAMLPATQAVVEKEIELKPGETLELQLELPFDAKAYEKAARAAASADSAAPPAAPPPAPKP